MDQKKKTVLLWSVIVVLAVTVVILAAVLIRGRNDRQQKTEAERETQTSVQEDQSTDTEMTEAGADKSEVSTEIYAEAAIGSTWDSNGKTAATENVVVHNKTDQTVKNWSVDLEFSGDVSIDQLWNGKYTVDGSVVHVTAESYNEEIPAGGSVDFGYNITAADVKPISCTVLVDGKEPATVSDNDQQAAGTDQLKDGENTETKTDAGQTTGEKAGQTNEQSGDSDKKDQSGSNKVTDSKTGKKEDDPYKMHGKLAVSGTDLVDASGNKFQLKGVSTHGLTWFADFVNKDTYQYFKDSFGINLVRFAMYTDTGDSYGYCSGGNKSEIEELLGKGVDAATDLGLYAIIDWHILSDNDPNMHIDDAKDFFDRISKKYASYGNVIYEIANEPNGGTTWESVKSYAETIIPIIRKNAPDAVIIVGTPTWSQDVDVAATDPIKDQMNLMYAVHFYAATHRDDLRNKVQSALDSGLPIFVSEFGLCDASGNGSIDYDQSDAWFDLINDKNLSYAAWNISNKAETSSLFDSSCTKTGGFTDDDLSDSGRYIKEKIESSY